MKDLSHLREEIDALDERLIKLLSERVDLVREVGAYKRDHHLPPLDEARRKVVEKRWVALAILHGLSEVFAREMFGLIHDHAITLEEEKL